MSLPFLISILLVATTHTAEIPIRTGISQLQVDRAVANVPYSILFKTSLPDEIYNSLVTVSYVQNFSPNNGINLTSSCRAYTQTSMKCMLNSSVSNQYSVVYMSYVVSDHGSLLVGEYTHVFKLGTSTGLFQPLRIKPNVDSKFINKGNSLFVNFYPFVSGISSFDNDFSLSIDKQWFDSENLDLLMDLTIKQVHVQEITITFGFILYDSSVITVSLYEKQTLTPGSVPHGYIYGINNIRSSNSPPPRLLQARTIYDYSRTPIVAVDAANIVPAIQTYPKTKTTTKQFTRQFIPQPPSISAQLLRSGPQALDQLSFKSIYLNPTLFSSISQPDNLIDTNSSILQKLKEIGLFSNGSQGGGGYGYGLALDLGTDRIHKGITRHVHKSLGGIDDNLFNNLFATNGFVIMTNSNDIDQIYYYEANLKQTRAPIPASLQYWPNQSPSFISTTTTNKKQTITCSKGGKVVGIVIQIDYLQQKMVLKCVYCSPGTYVSPITKSCAPNPPVSKTSTPVATKGLGAIRKSSP